MLNSETSRWLPSGRGTRRRWLSASVAAVVTAGALMTVQAQDRAAHEPGHAGMGGMGGMGEMGMAHGGMGGPGMGLFSDRPEHMAHAVDHMLDGLNATEAQRNQIKQIVSAAAADLKTQHAAGRALHGQALDVFTAPSIDAAAAEGLRQQMLAQHDRASKRVMQAMLDIGRVLTPEQRAKLGARIKDREATMMDRMQRMKAMHQEHADRMKP